MLPRSGDTPRVVPHPTDYPCINRGMAKRGQARPYTVRFQFENAPEWALGSFTTREAAEFAREQQADRVGPDGQTCEAWIVERDAR